MSDEILSLIKKKKSSKKENQVVAKKATWLIFTIGANEDKVLCALPAGQVKEILRDSTIFPLPFVPSYVDGVLNRYGDPYVVIDPAVITGKPAQKTLLFIVINDETHTCLRINDVKDFYTAAESDVVRFSEEEESAYFEGTLFFNGQNALVLKTQAFLNKVGQDIAVS